MAPVTTIESSLIYTMYIGAHQTGSVFVHGWHAADAVHFSHTLLAQSTTGGGPANMTVDRYNHADGNQGANIFVENKSAYIVKVDIFQTIARNIS